MTKRYERKKAKQAAALYDYIAVLGHDFADDANKFAEEFRRFTKHWGLPAMKALIDDCFKVQLDDRQAQRANAYFVLLKRLFTTPGATIHSLAKNIETESDGQIKFETAKRQIQDALHAAREDEQQNGWVLDFSNGKGGTKRRERDLTFIA